MTSDEEVINKWRLVLGKYADNNIEFSGEAGDYATMDKLLDFLYEREYGLDNGVRGEENNGDGKIGDGSGRSWDRSGGRKGSNLTVPAWITKVRELFPKRTAEILEKHAIHKYNMKELLTNRETLEKMEPNQELLNSILQLKHMMSGEVLHTARRIVKKIVEEITKKLETNIKNSITGRIDKYKSSTIKCARNLNFKKTVRRNLKNYDSEKNQIVIDRVFFNEKVKRYNPWNIIIVVDESGSMLDSVIYSAVMAGIFSKLPMLKTKLIIFDTQVVDLSDRIDDPVEMLMSIQLGGGTDIAKALTYTEKMIEEPRKTIVVLVSDLYEGGHYKNMYARAKGLIESGAKLIVLTALDSKANPSYDRNAGEVMAGLGAHVAALTPEELAKWVAGIV